MANILTLKNVKETSTSSNTIYSDVDKLFNIENNDINLYQNYDAIIQSLSNIISTQKGEMPFLMEFGTNLQKYIYENVTDTTLDKIRRELIDQVQRWEDRVEIIDAKISVFEKIGRIKIDLIFNVGETTIRKEFVIEKNYSLPRG